MIRMPTPAVNPTITSFETKLTSAPMRSSPRATIVAPDSNASVSASETYSADSGCASGLKVAKTNRDTALVGPETVCSDEPNKAATAVGTMAQYSPY